MTSATDLQIEWVTGEALKHPEFLASWAAFTTRTDGYCSSAGWLLATSQGLKHDPHVLIARRGQQWVGVLPLSFIRSALFGRFLISLPYVNTAGVVALDEQASRGLIDRAVDLADSLNVRYLELRHERPVEHARLNQQRTDKVHMRLLLPDTADDLWKALSPKVRNQIRKGQKQNFEIHWGGQDVLEDFYAVFSRNMRDLGTPVFSRDLFSSILKAYPEEAEFCTLTTGGKAAAGSLLIHEPGSTQVPSASALREYNRQNVNMLMYWQLLCRAIERGQKTFDFGRSSQESNTFRFKKQWGAEGQPAVWQYYVRKGSISEMRPESKKYRLLIKTWQRLPVPLTQWIGPPIVRGIP
jgi:FemAB-related protein (PEP-CTERM system-associated)